MSRKVSSTTFKLDPGSVQNSRRAEGKQNLAYGSKKMRNQANCTQYFVKNDVSKSKVTPDQSKSVVIDKDKTRTLKKSVSRSALLLPESEFYEKVSKQLSGKLSFTKESSPSRDSGVYPQLGELLKTSRVVNDEAARKSLATLAEEVCYVPRLISNDNSSQKKSYQVSPKLNRQPFTRPFGRSEENLGKSLERRDQVGNVETLQRSPNTVSLYDSKRPEQLKSSNFSSKNDAIRNKYSASSSDFKQSSLKRNLLRKQMNTKTNESTSGLSKNHHYIESIENKIEKALERSRSRGKLVDFTQQMPSVPNSNDSQSNSKVPYSSTGELRLTEGSREMHSTDKKLNWDGNTRSTQYPREGTCSAIDLKDYGADKENLTKLNTASRDKLGKLESNSDLKFFQKNNLSGLHHSEQLYRKRNLGPTGQEADYQSKGACTLDRIDKILKEVKPMYLRDSTPDILLAHDAFDKRPLDNQGVDIGHFNSFKEDLRKPEYTPSVKKGHIPYENAEFSAQKKNHHRINEDDQKSNTELNRNLSKISGISRNYEGERFTYDEVGTPSLLQANKGITDRSGTILIRGDSSRETGRIEESTSRQGPIELNHNFVKRTWNLRFVSSQELKVLVAESIIFIGDKKNGLKCGKGKFITERSGVMLYEGSFYDNLYHGFGRLVNPKSHSLTSATWYYNLDEIENWVKYEGHFSGGLPEGIGTIHINTGEYMTAEFTRGRVTGSGTVYNSSCVPILSAEWSDNILSEKTFN